MAVIYNEKELRRYMQQAENISFEAPLLLDHFLDHAIEVDLDVVCDGKDVLIGGIMEHIEQAGIHSGDSACTLPPYSLSEDMQN
ncbi:MAG: ATP-binding protein, partial [Nostoc sp.]